MAGQKQIITQIKRNDSGVYYIKNLNNNKLYIGQSIQLRTRIEHHIYMLENGKHIIKELQEDYNKGDRFKIGIVQKAPKHLLGGLEIYYILKWNTHIVGYNDKIGITDNFDDAIKAMITPKQVEQLEKENLEESLKIAQADTFKDSSLTTIYYLMNRNNWTIDDLFYYFKTTSDYWLNKL